MVTQSRIDWISATLPHTAKDWELPLCDGKYKVISPRNGYDSAIQYHTGVIAQRSSKRKDMGLNVMYTGKVLTLDDSGGCNTLAAIVPMGAKLSRIDIAIDVIDEGLSIESLTDAINEGRSTKHGKTSTTLIAAIDRTVETLYVGSLKNRRKLLRVYNKAIESELNLDDYKRIELAVYGHSLTRQITPLLTDSSGFESAVRSIVKGFIDIDDEVWSRVMGEVPSQRITIPQSDGTQREKWLLNAVVPALAQAIVDNPSFVDQFNGQLAAHIKQLIGEYK